MTAKNARHILLKFSKLLRSVTKINHRPDKKLKKQVLGENSIFGGV